MKSGIFQAGFQRSRLHRQLVWLMCGILMLLFGIYFEGWRLWFLCLLTAISTFYALRKPKQYVQGVCVRHHQAWLMIHNTEYPATLLGSSFIHPYVCFFHWQLETGKIWQCVLPDMLTADDFRRLRVWARFSQHHLF